MDKIIQRFINYISYDTKSDPDSKTFPSTSGQLVLGKALAKELKEIGVEDVYQDEHGYVYGTIPGNVANVPTIGFIAHMDTAPDLDGKCINPQIIEDYDGRDITLNDRYALTNEEFPFLKDLKGHTVITTDGTTLLGADDKAGITIIMTAIEEIIQSDMKHGTIKIAFTPDEEIGQGTDHFDVKGFNADFAYTIDGGPEGELEYENFNAASAFIEIQGKNVHPGSAKNIMVNSLRIAMELESLLPVDEKPEYTENYEGFYLLDAIHGTVDHTKMEYIIRDHSMEKFKEKKAFMKDIVAFLNKKYGEKITLKMEDSYYNMKEKIKPHMEIIDLAKDSMEEIGVEPLIKAIRGGTDGAQLSYKGLPTPNLFTGGYNYHGRFEILSVDTMKKSKELVKKIIEKNGATK
ncbi:MAG: peptidase T [Tissierellia bacterium]|nr:peptidase T [Tissierellia bacterium]